MPVRIPGMIMAGILMVVVEIHVNSRYSSFSFTVIHIRGMLVSNAQKWSH